MKDRLAYLPLFVRDFLSDPDVLQMRWLDQAIYLRMLMASWEAGPLPDDATMIGRLIDAPRLGPELEAFGAEFDANDAIVGILEGCWHRTERGWISPRLEIERERALAILRRQSEGGIEGNRKRWGNRSLIADRSVSDLTQIASQAQAQVKNQTPERACAREGGDFQSRNGKKTVEPWRGALDGELLGDGFPAAWDRWQRYKHERLESVTQVSGDALLARCRAFGAKASAKALDKAAGQGWKGPVLEADEEDAGLPISREIRERTGPTCSSCGHWAKDHNGNCKHCRRKFDLPIG